MIRVLVTDAAIDVAAELDALERAGGGAVATFTGLVRDDGGVEELFLEHYPVATEKALNDLAAEAAQRWSLAAATVIHRVGRLTPGENIVLVLTASQHRQAAFEAAEFLMDYLKTNAPFWKREEGKSGASWVEAREHDDAAAARWTKS